MRKLLVAASIVIALTAHAEARTHHHYYHHHVHHLAQGSLSHSQNYQPWAWSGDNQVWGGGRNERPRFRHVHIAREREAREHYEGGRPREWCGWWMANHFGFVGAIARNLWLAANWAHMGSPTNPHEGAVVVYPHHVAQIVGPCNGRICTMISGNDGHAVRTRPRSLAGAIAIRDVGGRS